MAPNLTRAFTNNGSKVGFEAIRALVGNEVYREATPVIRPSLEFAPSVGAPALNA